MTEIKPMSIKEMASETLRHTANLERENERLRKALETIVSKDKSGGCSRAALGNIARAALASHASQSSGVVSHEARDLKDKLEEVESAVRQSLMDAAYEHRGDRAVASGR